MRIIARPMLREFVGRHPEAAPAVETWYRAMKRTTFRTPSELRAAFPQVDFLTGGITAFNLGAHRLVAHVRYDLQAVYLLAMMTHAEYDRNSWKYRKRID